MENRSIFIGLIVSIVLNFLFIIAGIILPLLKSEIYRGCQPEGLVYDGNGPYCVAISRSTSNGSISVSFYTALDNSSKQTVTFNISGINLDDAFDKPEWWDKGVFLSFSTGHEVYIPKEAFVKAIQ